jgi:amidase
MTKFDEYASLDGMAQADLVRRGEVTAAELVEAAIGRIERLNPDLNAVIRPLFDDAREAAKGPLPEGPFSGVPFLLKDLLAEIAGVPLVEGSGFLDGHYVSGADCELVRRLKAAGLIIVGKTNTPEFGLLPTTEPRLTGPTRNPWDRGRTAGGSSGGSAAAVAAGLTAMAHANDGGGSIRIPASCCGVFGLKPTRGRNPLGPHYGDLMNGLVSEHAVTRSVRDSAALLDATRGPAVGDPYGAPPPARPYTDEVGQDPGKLRIALSLAPVTDSAVHPDCLAAVRETAALCADLGHEVEEAAPALETGPAARVASPSPSTSRPRPGACTRTPSAAAAPIICLPSRTCSASAATWPPSFRTTISGSPPPSGRRPSLSVTSTGLRNRGRRPASASTSTRASR